jgi:uncharacterized membrane protein YqgA involved in biofilm formation
MKLNQFEQLVLYSLACILKQSHPHVNYFIMTCISNMEIVGNIKEGIHEAQDYLRGVKE